jgi:hypothetical protein
MIDIDDKPIRLVDEFFYKPAFLVDEEDFTGYEVFRLQHKNSLRNKL